MIGCMLPDECLTTQREPRSTPCCKSTTTVVHLPEGCSRRCTPLAQLYMSNRRNVALRCTTRVLLSFWQVYRKEYTLYTLQFHLGIHHGSATGEGAKGWQPNGLHQTWNGSQIIQSLPNKKWSILLTVAASITFHDKLHRTGIVRLMSVQISLKLCCLFTVEGGNGS